MGFYFYSYAAALAAFIIITRSILNEATNKNNNDSTLSSFNGLAKSHPYLAGVMTISLFSLIGIPPLAGFLGKFGILTALLHFKQQFYWIAIVVAIMIAITSYPYLKIIKNLYFMSEELIVQKNLSFLEKIALVLSLTIIILSFCFYRNIILWI